ncbi:MAG: MFS transporter [Litorimonas sp.]
MANEIGGTAPGAARKTSGRTLALVLLTLVYAFNFIDRQIIGIVSPFIKEDLGFTDAQLGWLKGFAFAVVYCTFAIPIALLADKFSRVKIVAISLTVWSGFTALTGMANTFLTMLLARMGVGIGEAGGSPPSHSIISDLYAKEERATALGIYSLGIPFGIMFAYFAAGALIARVGWRGTLIVLGVTGIALAAVLLLLVREPQRGAMDVADSAEPAPKVPYGQMLATLLTIPSWWLMCLGVAFVSFGGYAISNWGIDYLVRWDPSIMEPAAFQQLNIWFGLMNGVAYGLGTYGGAKMADILGRKSVRAYGWLPGVVLFVGVPALIYAFWVDSLVLHLILITVYLVAAGFYLGPSFAIAQTLAPIRMRAMSTALFFFILNMIALGGGPTIVGIVSSALEPVHGETHALRLAITWLWLPYVLGIICFLLAARTLPKDWADAEARNAAQTG